MSTQNMTTEKRILMLGGAYFQIPPIICAKESGHYVITCDYLPENPGHKFADEYHNISTTDLDGVLHLAKELNIDGIVAYASDPAAPTAAYVAEKLGLPGNPFDSAMILTHKDRFRDFLKLNGFNTPQSKGFANIDEARNFFTTIRKPAVLKPTDSSGSKGVHKILTIDEFDDAFKNSLEFSREKRVIVEEFIEGKGYRLTGDGFVVDGNLTFICFANGHSDANCNPLASIGVSFPAIHDKALLDTAQKDLQRLMTLLHWKNGAINFDIIFDKDDNLYLIEVGPRNGGNLIPSVIKIATGVDLIKYTLDSALGLDCSSLKMTEPTGYYSSYIVHSNADGTLKSIDSSLLGADIISYQEFIPPGKYVKKFDGSNHTIGAMILHHNSCEEMLERMAHMEKYISIILEEKME